MAEGLDSPTNLAFTPDGRIFVTEQDGAVRIIQNGNVLAEPFITLPTSVAGERGLLGVLFDPGPRTPSFALRRSRTQHARDCRRAVHKH
jgi:glucose/arabinose dehydrogenase